MIVRAKVSLDRVGDFLRNRPVADVPLFRRPNPIASNASTNSSLSRRKFGLRIEDEDVFRQGEIDLIVGSTGCGETSFLMALLGEIPSGRTHGSIFPDNSGPERDHPR